MVSLKNNSVTPLKLKIFFFLILFLFLPVCAFAQSASVTWELSSNTSVTQTVGKIIGHEEYLSNMDVHDYSQVDGVTGLSQGTIITGGLWPAETSQNDARYIQFAVSVKPGITFNIDSVSFYYAGRGGHNVKINVAFATDSNFINSIKLNPKNSPISNSDNVPTMLYYNFPIAGHSISYPQTFYVRIFPWYTLSLYTKYVCLHDFKIIGTTLGKVIPVEPIVSTSEPTDISITKALCGGTVLYDGDADITERGICLNNTGNPTINDNKVIVGSGLGDFSKTINGLTKNTKYYLRAYAINSAGTGYGNEDSLTTLNNLSSPTVITIGSTKNIGTTVFCYGNVTQWGGTEISERGFCYNTSGNPTITDQRDWVEGNTGKYSITFTKLKSNTTFYFRAYAKNLLGTGYGNEIKIDIPSTLKNSFADGIHKDTQAIQDAIDSCSNIGGGIVKLENGIYLTAPIELKSNVTLEVDVSAKIIASQDYADFYPIGFDSTGGKFPTSLRPLITSNYADNIKITGKGIIDGRGEPWWNDYNLGVISIRPRLIQINHGNHIYLKNITLKNSPQFHFVPSWCVDVVVDSVTILSPGDSPNTDGIDPATSHKVRITNCYIDTGDDNVAIKSGSHDPNYPNAGSSDIIISDCTFLHGHGVSIGSETNGGVDSMLVTNCTFTGTDNGIRIKSNRTRGGNVRNVTYSDLTMNRVKYPILFSEYYPDLPDQNDPAQSITSTTPYYHNITVKNLTATNCNVGGLIIGLPETPMTQIRLLNVNISANTGLKIRNATVDTSNFKITVNSGSSIIFERNGLFTDVETNQNQLSPASFKLYQNYPNPFNPVTKIKYSVPFVETHRDASVQLKIYNIVGQEVATLVNEKERPGIYEITFNASYLPSGIYFYKLQAGSFSETKKLVFIK